jgi:uncharacterized Zn-finger protein
MMVKFNCSEEGCGKFFRSSDLLRAHLRHAHKIEDLPRESVPRPALLSQPKPKKHPKTGT